jgi:predicted O-methyltransferase YrrM
MRRQKRMHWLAFWINKEGWTRGAEIGAATGNTTIHLMNHCHDLEELIIVDDWRPIPHATNAKWKGFEMKREFDDKLKDHKHRLAIFEGISWDMAEFVNNQSLDFAFIDASHDYESVTKDIEAWWPKVKHGGMLCGHDLHFPGVKKALEEQFGDAFKPVDIDNCWYVDRL